ncbi:MAG: hypothetical protein HY726_12165 [Candidatus Rokubacteria bacterium]|nr:hypothetical protein [Candidatus Rokubacteria bacterium]
MPVHGWIGLVVLALAESLLFAGNRLVGEWFTPLVWTGYILLADGLVARWTGDSYLTTRRLELVLVVLASVSSWWLFEFYNAPRFWRGGAALEGLWWHYHNLEPNPFLRRVGYDWAFATIFPGLFLTAELLKARVFARLVGLRAIRVPAWALRLSVVLGAVAALLPLLVVSAWLVPLVWVAYALLLEPLNYWRGSRSWLREIQTGDYRTLAALLGSGTICGILWEFWNYWALIRWTYTVPYWAEAKLFEMPVLGYLGFPAFALEAFAMYHFVASLVAPTRSPLPGRATS